MTQEETEEWLPPGLCSAVDRETGLSCTLPEDHEGQHETSPVKVLEPAGQAGTYPPWIERER